ncbi:hypothetical protein NQ315_015408 [Exocentrus adspersus]|uniref:Regulatory protein zeste n=1 Tax=Exocentrus adspersus TaxID=1586481 RepID=A0AAV8V5N8_9CUCU|nr:hypothetical protein NQ315_015408 [Exocentrus adspersus]
METIVNFLDENRVMVSGKCHPMKAKEIEEKWDTLTEMLNNVDNGARKMKEQWKTVSIIKKARLNKAAITQTGGGGYSSSELTDLENRLLGILGWIHIIGCPNVPKELDPDQEQEPEPQQPDQSEENLVNQEPLLYDEQGQTIELIDIDNIVLNVPSTSNTTQANLSTPKTVPGKKTSKKESNLQQSAELYSQSTHEMAVAVKEMAAAISQLAVALSNIALALSTDKEKEK